MPTQRWIPAVMRWCCLLLALAHAPLLRAAPAHANFTVKKWDTEDGLPENAVIAMTQTREGYLWLGTLNGLARFDGIRFTPFNAYNTPGLGSSPVVFLFADRHDNLWVGTESAGAVVIKAGKVTPLDIGSRSRAGRLTAACEDERGAVWLCTANGQLCRYLDGNVSVWEMPAVVQIPQTPDPILVGEYRALAVEAGGSLWVGADHLLSELDPRKIIPGQSLPPPRQRFVVATNLDLLLPSSHGGIWLLANGGVQKIGKSPTTPERDFVSYPWTNALVTAACEDRQGNLIVSTVGHGVGWFDADGHAEELTSASGLSHDTILSLCVDKEGSLWAGTDGRGLNRVRRQAFAVLEPVRDRTIKSVCEDRDGGLWIGTFGGGVLYWDGSVLGELGAAEGNTNFFVGAVYADTNKTIWVGVLRQGLFRFQAGVFGRAPGAETLNPDVSVIHQDRGGKLWVGTQDGLASWDGYAWTNCPGLAGYAVQAIADDAAGNLWIGTGNGLRGWRDGQPTWFHVKDGLPSGDVSALLADADGALWVGTRVSGLARFADGKWTHYSTDNGLADNSINYLAEDGEGYLWIGSFTGLMRVAKADLNDFAQDPSKTVRCRTYGSADGLPTANCSSGSQPAAWRTRTGRLWFATTRGLVSIDPTKLSPNTNPPPVMIEQVFVDDKLQNTNRLRLNWPAQVIIPAGRERLEIRYTSLNLLAPERARFKYQLDNESGWTDARDSRVAHYSNLSPRQYRFHVQAANEDGVWNEVGAVLDVIVEPPFWRTWWFMTLCATALLGSIVGTVHFISTQKLQRQLARLKQQEALEKERSRIARDLHDQLGANLTQVSLLGEMVESDKDLPDEVGAHARQISETARATALALDEIVWSANPSNDTLEGLVTYTCKYAQEYLAVAGLSYRLEAPEKLPAIPIPPDVRHNVFLAFKESVNNVVKHARATAVKVRVRLEPHRFILEIEDNGRGVAEADKAKGRNGLRNMSKRMEDVHGEFLLGPGAQGGTLVRLTAPCENTAPLSA